MIVTHEKSTELHNNSYFYLFMFMWENDYSSTPVELVLSGDELVLSGDHELTSSGSIYQGKGEASSLYINF